MKREVKIGIFAIAVICCSWAGIRFLSGIDVFGRSVEYYACYDKINGISNASPILVQGVKVGTVRDIILDPAQSNKVTLKFSISKRYKIPQNSEACIFSPGLMSSMAIGITLGDSPVYLEEGDTIISAVEPNLMDVAADKLIVVTDQITTLSDELTTTIDSINHLLVNNSDNLTKTMTSLNSLSSDLATIIDSQSGNIESTLEGLSQFTTAVGDKADTLVNDLSIIAKQLADADLGSSLNTTLSELKTTLTKLNSEEGSAGKFMNDEELYENMAAVSSSLNELLIDMQSNPKRYVHFSLFGSKVKEVEKQ